MIGGAIAATAAYAIASTITGQPVTFDGLLAAAFIGAPAGLVLDLMEPATNPCHRSVCHSVVAAAAVGILAKQLWIDPIISPQARVWSTAFLAGIGSHYLLDSTTPKGLPFCGVKFDWDVLV